MVNLPGRNDRRRRVLKEEVFSASSAHASARAMSDSGATSGAPRYSDAASVENHPQITDFVPRHYGTIALLVFIGVGLTATLAALHFFAMPIAVGSGMQSIAALDVMSYGSLSAWLAAIVLFLATSACLLTYSIRRHRIDDYRGRYRVWLGAALACLMVSANSVVGLHQIAADVLGHFTGWTALRGGAVWWLLLAGLPIGWITFRAMLDMRECRVAAMLLFTAVLCYAASALSFLGFAPTVEPRIASLIIGAPLLLGHWLMFAAVVVYARFVVLDAQGLVTVRRRSATKTYAKSATAKKPAQQSTAPAIKPGGVLAAAGYTRPVPQPAKTPAEPGRWVDGSRPERERYDDEDDNSPGDDRKLSKSERKQLRKLKAQNRAA